MKYLPQALKELYKDRSKGPWNSGRTAQNYSPSPGGRAVVRLSVPATKVIIEHYRGKDSKDSAYLLINPEGMVRQKAKKTFTSWPLAVKVALDEGLYIYNARTKKTSRPVWQLEDAGERTFDNMLFESVHCVPHQKTYDKMLPRKTSRVFATD